MNKLEANLSLFAITFFAAVQYAFLSGVPEDVSQFLFLSLTNLIGFVFAIALFWGELFRVNRVLVRKSLLLAVELLGFNGLLMLGSAGTSSTVCACVLSAYFVFIAPIMALVFRKKTPAATLLGTGVVLVGLFLIFDAKFSAFADLHVLYLIGADLFFAAYVITVEMYASKENPAMLATGQMFWGFVLTALAFGAQTLMKGEPLAFPASPAFWGSVIFIGVFIRGIYGIVQIYAQRYVSALNTSLIFSTEIIMTMASAPAIYWIFGIAYTPARLLQVAGGILMVCGILLADSSITDALKRRWKREKKA